MKIVRAMVPAALAAALLLAAVALRSGAADEELDTAPAMAAIQAWLAEVDHGLYGSSWDDAAQFFRESITREKWEPMVAAQRAPLGVMISRKVRSAVYTKELVNAPPGPYVVAQFDTRFENRPLATETLTAMLQADGAWKVSGYAVR